MITISSQRHLDSSIVALKVASRDYEVLVTPWFSAGGKLMRVVIDGHHSLAAANAVNVEPLYMIATPLHDDALDMLGTDPDGYLELRRIDSDYYNVATGRNIW